MPMIIQGIFIAWAEDRGERGEEDAEDAEKISPHAKTRRTQSPESFLNLAFFASWRELFLLLRALRVFFSASSASPL
jgi:hypothetical protein